MAALLIPACKNEVELPDQPLGNYSQVYMPQAVNGIVTKVLNISNDPQVVIYGACVSDYGVKRGDINLQFVVNSQVLDSFNTANGTNYELLPTSAYTMSDNKATIPANAISTTPLSISISTSGANALPIFKNYLLPISITGTDYKVNEKLRTTFFVISAQPNLADYPDYDRKNWTITGFSSQEAVGEGADNGRAVFVLDSNNNTFWHSQWRDANPGPPHFLTVDMGAAKTLHGIAITARQTDGGGKPNEVKIETSTDNVNWVTAGQINFANKKEAQKVFLKKFVDARYFKFIVLSSYSSTNTHLAELGAF